MKQEYLKEIIDYNPDIGTFIWKIQKAHCIKIGDTAGCLAKSNGYIGIQINGKIYKAHRLAWFYMTGKWPKNQIDHINHVRDDNRFVNLREATRSENLYNSPIYKNNTSKYKGVSWNKRDHKWQCYIKINKKTKFLGCFLSLLEASEAYEKAAKEFHGEFYYKN